jgi:hypothetical protein
MGYCCTIKKRLNAFTVEFAAGKKFGLSGSFCSTMGAKRGCLRKQGAAVFAGYNYYFPYNLPYTFVFSALI